MKFTVGKKIGAGFTVILILLVILGGNAFLNLRSSEEKLAEIDTASNRLITLNNVNSSFLNGVAAFRGYLAYGDERYAFQNIL